MTLPHTKPASFTRMHLYPLLLAAACLVLTARAEEPTLRDLLRDGLYAEEVTRDPAAAANHYEQVLARYSDQRAFAASALFRLAEVRRKQDRKEDAVKLYQQLLAEFPGAEAESRLARENLAALGGKPPAADVPSINNESREIARLEALAKTAPDIILDPATLEEAVKKGWSEVVTYLLAAGSRPYAGNAVRFAAEGGFLEITRQLTAGDAPVPQSVATAGIQAAIKFKRYTVLDFLLKRGFKPGDMTNQYENLQHSNALAYAFLTGSSQCAEILLKYGADIDATSEQSGDLETGGTALQRVIYHGKFEAANWLLDKGAKPDIPSKGFGITPLHETIVYRSEGSLALMQRLLEAGADPNRRRGVGNITPLALAVDSGSKTLEKLRLLLEHGADPKLDGNLIRGLADQGAPLECVKVLVDAGAMPESAWLKLSLVGNRGDVRDFLVEKFIIPGFANDSEIQFVIDGPYGIKSSQIALRAGDADPPDFGVWLLDNHQNSEWPYDKGGSLNYEWLILRKGKSGLLERETIDFSGSARFPALEWGDIVECRITQPSRGGGYSSRKGLPADMLWSLRKRITFPVTFEIEGNTREVIVRGDRLLFDPTKNEVPLEDLQSVAEFLCQQAPVMKPAPVIHVQRKNWPDVRLTFGSKEAGKFQLAAGDRVKLEIPDELRSSLVKALEPYVTLKVDGFPFARSFGVTEGGKPVEGSIPTLIQALVDAQCPPYSYLWQKLAEMKSWDTEFSAYFNKFTQLPHPDLAHIRIRRMQDGAEKVTEVDLAKIIAAANDATTVEEARKSDVLLQPGDVVEISLIKERLSGPWKGFTPQEEAFFSKALAGRVQITDGQGNMSVRDILFKSPRFVETESGWIPMPPESGVPTVRGMWLTNERAMAVKRGDRDSGSQISSDLFLRDGDEIRTGGASRPTPRVVPPPQPGQR